MHNLLSTGIDDLIGQCEAQKRMGLPSPGHQEYLNSVEEVDMELPALGLVSAKLSFFYNSQGYVELMLEARRKDQIGKGIFLFQEDASSHGQAKASLVLASKKEELTTNLPPLARLSLLLDNQKRANYSPLTRKFSR